MRQLVEKIVEELQNHGPISFARFMEYALYCPVLGYYEKEEDTLGRRGDYYTSVSVGPLFGELLAFQFADWLAGLPLSSANVPLLIVEAGAHHGHLAKDILTWLRANRPALGHPIEYCIVEPSSRRQDWQRRTLAGFHPQVRWVNSLAEVSENAELETPPNSRTVRGVIFCNELLDALPVRRLGWDAARSVWFEWGVTFSNGRFGWTRLEEQPSPSTLGLNAGPERLIPTASTALPSHLLNPLPDGFTVDLCPAASEWWGQAAGILECGKLLAIDYGLTKHELFSPERTGGTLRAYRKHHLGTDVLEDPGEQDITAHVDFSAIREAGECAGLKTELWSTQEQFLTRIAAMTFSQSAALGAWTTERTRQFQTLTHPNHLGRVFRVLLQSR